MALQAQNGKRENLQKSILVTGTIVASGNYTQIAGGGDALNLAAATNKPGEAGVEGAGLPTFIQINGVNGYNYGYIPGTTRANGKLKVTTAAGAELAVGAYPAGVTGDTITFEAHYTKGV